MSLNTIIKQVIINTEYLTCKKSKNSKIIYYHDVHDDLKNAEYTSMSTPLYLFKQHIESLRGNGFVTVKSISEQQGQILIAFDDGWKGIYDNKDYFISNQIFPSICIAPGLINHPSYLSEVQVLDLYNNGFNFVCHSWSHQSLTLYNDNKDALRRELSDSKKYIEDLLSTEVDTICYPNGFFNKIIYEKSLEYGFKKIWSSIAGDYFDEPIRNVKRRCLVQDSNLHNFKEALLGANRALGKKQFRYSYSK